MQMKAAQPEKYVPTALDKRIEHWLTHSCPPFLIIIGPPGYGKSLTMSKVLERHEFPYEWISATRGSILLHYLGYWRLAGGETQWVEGQLLQGLMKEDCVIVFDDIHTIAQDTQILNGVGDHTRRISIPELGLSVDVASGVRIVFIANPPPSGLAPWERIKWELPEQIRGRARMISLTEAGLSHEEERAIALLHWSADHRVELFDGLLEVTRNLRNNGLLQSYTPSVRDLVIACQLLAQGESIGTAFLEAIANKYLLKDERQAAIEAFRAKLGIDPLGDGSSVLVGGNHG